MAYAPVHAEVRSIERSIARDEKEIKQLQRDLRNETSVSKRNKYQSKIAELQADIENSRDKIPADWQKINKEFKKLTAELNSSRTKLRRQSDQTYVDIRLLATSIDAEGELAALADRARQMRTAAATSSAADLLDDVQEVYNALKNIPDAKGAAKPLSDARRALNNAAPDMAKARIQIDMSLAAIDDELAWRRAAKSGLYTQLLAFETYARNNLGLREQDRLTPEQVDFVTPCLAQHRSLALQF